MAIRIQLRRDTAANWISSNPTLRAGEIGIETDTLKFKIGNGSSTWTAIAAYANITPTGLSSSLGDYILQSAQGTPTGPAELNSDGDLIIPENSIILWNDTAHTYSTTLTATEPTADRTITFPNVTGTVALTANIPSSTTALSEGTNLYFTDERAQDAVATALAAGTHTNISVSYNDAGNAISLTGAQTYNDENAQDAIGNNLGTGLSYNDTTGAISVDTSTIQARVTNVDDTEIGYLDGVTSSIQTQIDTKAPLASPTLTGTPTAPTAAAATNTTQVATTAFVRGEVTALVNGASAALDTLGELAAALTADEATAATLATLVGTKAPIASPTFTGTVSGITKTMVGLGSVDNTTDAAKPVSTATQTALDLKAALASPTFTGTVSGITKTMVGLGNVENTELSTWAGSSSITTLGTIATGVWSGTTIDTTKGGTGLSTYTTGDILYSSASDTLAKLSAGTNGQILTLAAGIPSWAAAPITLPSQTGNSGYYLTTDGTSASWGALVVPITTGTATVSANTATTVDTTALSAFTSIEYMVSLKQGSKVRTSKVVVQTDGTSVDMTEFAITETGGTIAGVVISAAVSSTNGVLQLTVTDAATTNVTVKFSKVAL